MRRELVWRREILQRISYIEEDTIGGWATFSSNRQSRDAVERNIEIIGEIVKRLNPKLLEAYPDIPWSEIAQFRDFLIHHYDRVEKETVWQIVQYDLPPLKQAVNQILEGLLSDSSSSVQESTQE